MRASSLPGRAGVRSPNAGGWGSCSSRPPRELRMKSRHLAFAASGIVCVGLATGVTAQRAATPPPPAPKPAAAAPSTPAPAARPAIARANTTPAPSHAAPSMSAADQTALVKRYCATCHSEKAKAGGLSLADFDATQGRRSRRRRRRRSIRKLRAGMMPPKGAKHPGEAQLASLVSSVETPHRRVRLQQPEPGAAHLPAAQPARVPAGHPGAARPRRQRRPTGCRSTRRAPTSTTSPTSRGCRRRSSSRT